MLLVGFVVWFAIEPRTIWPGVLLFLGLGVLLLCLLGVIAAQGLHAIHNERQLGVSLLAVAVLAMLTLPIYLLANGVTVVRREGFGRSALLSLGTGGALLAYPIVAVVCLLAGAQRLAFLLILVAGPLSFLACSFAAMVLYSWVYRFWFNRFGPPPTAVVVLGAGLRGGRTVTRLLANRLDKGMAVAKRAARPELTSEPAPDQASGPTPELARASAETRGVDEGHRSFMVTSGGQGPDEVVSEAQAMAEYLQEHGWPADAIIKESRSRNTEENLAFSKALLDEVGLQGQVAVVTNNFHAFRAATMMRRAGMAGYAVGAPTAWYYVPSATIREFLAFLRDYKVAVIVMLVLSSLPLLVATGIAVASLVHP